MAMPVSSNQPIVMSQLNLLSTVPSIINPTHTDTISPSVFTITPSPNNPTVPSQPTTNTLSHSHPRPSSLPNFRPTTSSSSTSSDEELQGRQTNKKRKWKDFFERLMKDAIDRQEQLQKKFLETIEKREHDRMAREEAWRMQEMARLNREHEILVQERSMAAAKDTAVIAFLQKISDQHQIPVQLFQSQEISPARQAHTQSHTIQVQSQTPTPAHTQSHAHVQIQTQGPPSQPPPPPTAAQAPQPLPTRAKIMDIPKPDNGNIQSTSSRWPKAEVQALISLRADLDLKYQESGPKGPLWEEISSGMKKLGYNRNAKRCKEKWENINKYFKKVKESNKQRPEDSKTCPYFHLLDALYKEKNKGGCDIYPSYELNNKLENVHSNPTSMAPLMVQPEQQWPPLPSQEVQHRQGNVGSQNIYENKEEEEEDEEDEEDLEDEEEDDEGDEEEDNGTAYEIVANKQQATGSMSAAE